MSGSLHITSRTPRAKHLVFTGGPRVCAAGNAMGNRSSKMESPDPKEETLTFVPLKPCM